MKIIMLNTPEHTYPSSTPTHPHACAVCKMNSLKTQAHLFIYKSPSSRYTCTLPHVSYNALKGHFPLNEFIALKINVT